MRGTLRRRADLSGGELERMHALLCSQFETVSRARFLSDLADKSWVVTLSDGDGSIRGFSSLDCYEGRHEGSVVTVVCSGDTVVDAAHAGSPALSAAWIGAVQRLRALHPRGRMVWLLIVSGYRTYRFLPVFWRRFVPRHDQENPEADARLLDALATARFGASYDRGTGIVRLPEPQILRPELRGVPEPRLADPHVRFFVSRNPGHERGDELACLAELSRDNLTPAGLRMWAMGERAIRGPDDAEGP